VWAWNATVHFGSGIYTRGASSPGFFGLWRSLVLRKTVVLQKNMEPIKFGIASFSSVPSRTEKSNSTQISCNSIFNIVLTSKARHQHSARVQDTKTAHYDTIFGSSVSSVNRGGNRFYRTNFSSSEMRTEQGTETSVLGKFGSVLVFSVRFSVKFAQS